MIKEHMHTHARSHLCVRVAAQIMKKLSNMSEERVNCLKGLQTATVFKGVI